MPNPGKNQADDYSDWDPGPNTYSPYTPNKFGTYEGILIDRTEPLVQSLKDQAGYGMKNLDPLSIFMAPGAPVVLPPAPLKPTVPKIITPKPWAPNFAAQARAGEFLKPGFYKNLKPTRAMKAARLASALGPTAGFMLGWELGDYLFPNGWYSFGVGEPDQSAGPDGWTFTAFGGLSVSWMAPPCPTAGPYKYHAGYNIPGHALIHSAQSQPGSCGATSGIFDPDFVTEPRLGFAQGLPGSFGNTIAIKQQRTENARWLPVGGASVVGTGSSDVITDPDNWTQVFTPSPTPMPLVRSLPSEAPETFPLEQAMDWPYPQKWKDAKPKPKSQGEGKHLRRSSYPISPMPLAPFPITQVIPPVAGPGVGTPPPPDQVITLPPPGRGKPPTYHTTPPAGRTPPGSKTKEKKLSVRSVANKAWIVLNLATEGFDLVDALFQAIPKSCQDKAKASIDYGKEGGGKADPYSKAKAVYDCFGEIDWDKFVNVFINQQLTDMAVGLIGMSAQKYLKLTGQATGSGGLASKPSSTADKFLEDWVADQVEAGNLTPEQGKEIIERGELPIPQVEYQGDGVWTVSFGTLLTFS